MRALTPLVAVTITMLLPSVALGARAYEDAGAKAVSVKALDATTSLVAPTSGGPYPLLVASHGFSASGDNQLGWAKHFASWGFVVAVPSFPSPFAPDTATNAAIIEGLVAKLQGPLSAAEGVAGGPFGLEGHSAGGLATTVASMKLTPGATVLFDPVDRNAEGKTAYASLCSPVLAIFAGGSSCNNNAEWRGFAKSTTAELLAFDVKGSTHCDGENAGRALCGTFCGGAASAERQAVYAHYATAFFLARLTGDPAATSALATATVDGDADLAAVLRGTTTCAKPTADAGTSVDSGTPGSGPGGTSGGTPAAEPTSPDAGAGSEPAAADSGCGCRTVPGPASPTALALGVGALLAARRRRR